MTGIMFQVLKMNILAACVIVIGIFLGRLTKGKYSSKWKYYLWLGVMIVLLLPVNLSGKSPFKIRFGQEKLTAGDSCKAEAVSVPQVQGNTAVRSNGSAKLNMVRQQSGDINANAKQSTAAQSGTITQLLSSESQQNSTIRINCGTLPMEKLLTIISITWLAGVFFFGIERGLRYYFSLHRMIRWSYPADNEEMQELYFQICRKKHIQDPPRLLVCENLSSPMLAGIRAPGLYVPEKSFSLEEMEFIFSHELSHYVRHDLWYKMLMLIVTTIYWFNPALYVMQGEAEKDIENLCDGKMAVHYTKKDRLKYGQLLLQIAAEQNNIPYMSVGFSNGKKVFKDRILYMKNLKHLEEKVFPAIVLVMVMAVGNICVGVSMDTVQATAGELVDFQPDEEKDESRTRNEYVNLITDSSKTTDSEEASESKDFPTAEVGASPNNEVNQEADSAKSEPTEAEVNQAGQEQNGDSDSQSQENMDISNNIDYTGAEKTVWATDGSFASYIYEATNGNWYDGSGSVYYNKGGGNWTQAYSGASMTETAPPKPSDSAVSSTYVTDDSGYNSQILYQSADGTWMNNASGLYIDNGDGTFTGPDGNLWYVN